MKIAIWTKSPPKVAAIEEVINSSLFFKSEEISYDCEKVSSNVSDMPLSLEENMSWAKNRAQNTKIIVKDADYYIGMEWWTQIINDKAYLFGVCYIENKKWEWHFWFSPLLEVPKSIEKWLYIDWEELWPLMSKVSWEENIWHKNWSYWLWTEDQLTRKNQFHSAIICAFSPFLNKYYK